jgi:hypothetical protein
MTIDESRPTLVMIAGFSRAGKDTLASGLLEWSERRTAKVNFADPLKESANALLSYLHLEGDFFNEDFKVKNRDFLVAAGRFARSLNQDVFAEHLARYLPFVSADGQPHQTVVCSDWRYLNEYKVVSKIMDEYNWNLRTVHISTAGVLPANDEEAWSILDLRAEVEFDVELCFKPNSRNEIMAEGRRMARAWKL